MRHLGPRGNNRILRLADLRFFQIPINRVAQALLKIVPRLPTEFLPDARKIYGITSAMAEAIFNITDQIGMGQSKFTEDFETDAIKRIAERGHSNVNSQIWPQRANGEENVHSFHKLLNLRSTSEIATFDGMSRFLWL